MITFGEAKKELEKIRDITDESLVEVEHDYADGYYILRIPAQFNGQGYVFYDPEHDDLDE